MSICTRSFMSVSIPADWLVNAVDFSAVILSFVPWLITFICFGMLFVRSARQHPAFRALCVALFGAWLFCEVSKQIIRQPRPTGSCLSSLGMPSAHSAYSLVCIVFVAVQPKLTQLLGGGLGGTAASSDSNAFFGGIVDDQASPPSSRKNLCMRAGGLGLLGFVPWSRVHLSDHSVAQVCAGSTVGLLVAAGVLWWMSKQKKSG